MRAKEFIVEQQLDEVDWSKLKKAIAIGAISLASLGLSGISQADVQGMTDQQFIDHWHKWYPSQSDAEIMSALNNQKDLEKWSKDSQDRIAADYKERTNKINSDSAAEIAKIKADAEEAATARNQKRKLQQQQDIEKNSPPTPESQLSKFSIKGLRFGMSLSQVLSITKTSDTTNWMGPSWNEALKGFTIGGFNFHAEPEEYNRVGAIEELIKGKLGMLWATIAPGSFDETVEIFSTQFGKPTIEKIPVTTKLGFRDVNIIARWQVNDAHITIKKYAGNINKGSIVIDSVGSRNSRQQLQQQNKLKSNRDFE